jgi:hypothetical protein
VRREILAASHPRKMKLWVPFLEVAPRRAVAHQHEAGAGLDLLRAQERPHSKLDVLLHGQSPDIEKDRSIRICAPAAPQRLVRRFGLKSSPSTPRVSTPTRSKRSASRFAFA